MRTLVGGRRLTDTGSRSIPPINAIPDLSDPATAGVLVAMLLAADPTATIRIDPRESGALVRIVVSAGGRRVAVAGPDLGHAVAAALLATWPD